MTCFFGHRWKWHDSTQVDIYPHSKSTMPVRTQTEVSGLCVRCGKPKVMTINGHWSPA